VQGEEEEKEKADEDEEAKGRQLAGGNSEQFYRCCNTYTPAATDQTQTLQHETSQGEGGITTVYIH